MTYRRSRWVLAALVSLLLGAQVLQAAHLHMDHGLAPECVQCQAESGQAMAISEASTQSYLADSPIGRPAIPAAPISISFSLAARGPPSLSSC